MSNHSVRQGKTIFTRKDKKTEEFRTNKYNFLQHKCVSLQSYPVHCFLTLRFILWHLGGALALRLETTLLNSLHWRTIFSWAAVYTQKKSKINTSLPLLGDTRPIKHSCISRQWPGALPVTFTMSYSRFSSSWEFVSNIKYCHVLCYLRIRIYLTEERNCCLRSSLRGFFKASVTSLCLFH